MKQTLLETAKKVSWQILTRGDLEFRNNDDEDFIDLPVGTIQALLENAYELGKKECIAEEEANRKLKREIFRKAVAERNKELMKEREILI